MIDISYLTGLAILAGVAGAVFVACLFALFWRSVRSYLRDTSPELRSTLLLIALSLPVATALALVAITLSPLLEHGVVAHHCHTSGVPGCEPHALPPYDISLVLASLLLAAWLLLRPIIRLTGIVSRASETLKGLRLLSAYDEERDIRILNDNRILAFSLGIMHPAIFISSGLRHKLSAQELDTVISHERGHLYRRDALWRLVAEVLSFGHLPHVSQSLLEELHLASEQASDEFASEQIGEPWTIASTILKVERLCGGQAHVTPVEACSVMGSSVPARVKALIFPPRRYDTPGAVLTAIVVALVTLTVVLTSEPLHHLIESIL